MKSRGGRLINAPGAGPGGLVSKKLVTIGAEKCLWRELIDQMHFIFLYYAMIVLLPFPAIAAI